MSDDCTNIVSVTCDNCNTHFDFVADKQNVIDSKPDVMGWTLETYRCICPKCQSEVTGLCLF